MDNARTIIIVAWAIITCAYINTWNKYYFPRHRDGKKTSFGGYVQWLKATYLHANDDEWKD